MQQEGRSAERNLGLWILYGVILLGWSMFSYGFYWGRPIGGAALWARHAPLLVLVITLVAWRGREYWWPWLGAQLDLHTEGIDRLEMRHLGLAVAAAAALGLYTELMMIRLHSSYFQLFAYFKNVSLLSCFLGLGVGYTLGAKSRLLTPLVMPALAVQILLMNLLRTSGMESALQSPISEELGFGITSGEGSQLVTAYGFIILVFVFNAFCFVPLGQLASRVMSRMSKLTSYSWNLVGSLVGIAAFNLMAVFWAPPSVWLLLVVLGLMAFLWRAPAMLMTTVTAGFAVLAVLNIRTESTELETYSPYQQLTLSVQRDAPPELRVNQVYYQRLLGGAATAGADDQLLRTWREHYDLPYAFKPEPGRVLVVGAGTGNDVAAAVRAGAGSVDAVEIDPAILDFGRRLHPERPYQQPNVDASVGDARAYIRNAEARYDLIVYGLLDSHTLLSDKAGVRLDSYVYTVEAFREARSKLDDGGLISLTFSLIKPELGLKLYRMLVEAFDGQEPVVYSTGYDEGLAFLIGDGMDARAFPPVEGVRDVTETLATSETHVDVSTDNWPFFYMPVRKYPSSYVALILVLLVVSLVFVRQTVPGAGRGLSAPCFFLGAGFMLVETKGITELALVYGTTWAVIGVVLTGILLMAFLANVIVQRRGAPSPYVSYGLLFSALLLGLVVNSARLAGLPVWAQGPLLTVLLTLPLFFSGFAFSTELARAKSVGVALSSNLLGAMLGGFLEYNAMYFGFRSLYLLAFAIYGLAFLGSLRTSRARQGTASASTGAQINAA